MTPVKPEVLNRLLKATNYNKKETDFLVEGFKYGFTLGYCGPGNRHDKSSNIPFTVGDKAEMWEKMLKETELGRFAGPYKDIPFDEDFVQSPIGLVPKAGNKTRLIFHLSYDFPNGNKSINYWTPEEDCTVKYKDLDYAVRMTLNYLEKRRKEEACNICDTHNNEQAEDEWNHILDDLIDHKVIYYAKSDLLSAFRILPIFPGHRKYLIMKAENPKIPGRFFYFSDKSLPFGSSISCSHFTRFSNALLHIVMKTTSKTYQMSNYLDDFLFLSDSEEECNQLVRTFLSICEEISFPVSMEKTEWASKRLVFLGILLDGERHVLSIPIDKVERTITMLKWITDKKKATVKELERLSGLLNFLNKAIVPGRIFTRRMYAKIFRRSLVY